METAEGKTISISFDGKRCIHARFCVLGAPAVFKANTPGEWIFPDQMDTEKLVAVAEACPSGAITYKRKDGGKDEEPPPVNVLRVRENGPYAIHAPMAINGKVAGTRATLCRCGASKNKPYCDGSHTEAKFAATGEPAAEPSEPLAARDGTLKVVLTKDGPLAIKGNLELCSGTGRTINRVTTTWLCRCGGSSNKPYCDGTHSKIGFKSE
jgi:CDGSH-type Zn-finger protein/ferredoxin